MSYDKPLIKNGVTLEDEGILVPGGDHTTLNFVGAGVTVADAGSSEATITIPGGAASDELVKVSADDTTSGYLLDKVTATAGKIVLTEVTPGGDEDLNINIGADVFDKTTNNTDDITEGAVNKFNIVQDLYETVTGDSGTTTANLPTDSLAVTGGTGITTAVTADAVTITNDSPNIVQDLYETVTGDSGTTTANLPTDSLAVVGGTGIATAVTADTVTVTNSSPNVDQNIYETVTGDTGTTTANTTTDSLDVAGGTGITTAVTDDTVTITNSAPNIVQDLYETVTGDSGTTTANLPTDSLAVVGGTGITTAVTSDTVTVTNSSPNVDQDLWATVTGDSGSTTANTTTDTITIAGGTGITTSVAGDTLTIASSAVAANQAIAQARRTTDYTVTVAFADVTLDTTDEETDSAVIEHSVITDRIVLKETGNYLIGYFSNFDFESAVSEDTKVEGRMRLNDTTVIPGSFSRKGDHYSGSGVIGEDPFLCSYCVISATANDFITLQLRFTDDSPDTLEAQDAMMFAVRLQGKKGDTGATGAGSDIIVQKDDVTVGTVTDTLNFEGTAITSVVDDGGNKTTVTIDSGVSGQRIINDVITPTILTANTDDWNPTGLSTCNVIRASSDANRDLTGIVAQPSGTTIFLFNIGGSNIKLKNDATSVAANRFVLKADITIESDEGISIWYDGSSSRWRALIGAA